MSDAMCGRHDINKQSVVVSVWCCLIVIMFDYFIYTQSHVTKTHRHLPSYSLQTCHLTLSQGIMTRIYSVRCEVCSPGDWLGMTEISTHHQALL